MFDLKDAEIKDSEIKDAEIKDAEIKDEEAEMILQNRKWCHYVPRLLANLIRENKMASTVAAIWLPDTQRFFMGIEQYDYESTAATKRHGFSVLFFRLLCSQTGRIWRNFNCSKYEKCEESYAQLLGILNELRCHGEVGRPRFLESFQLFSGKC